MHIISVIKVPNVKRCQGNDFSLIQVRQSIGSLHVNTDFVTGRIVSDAPRPNDADKSGADRAGVWIAD